MNGWTVQDLIDALNRVEDKSLPVMMSVPTHDYWGTIGAYNVADVQPALAQWHDRIDGYKLPANPRYVEPGAKKVYVLGIVPDWMEGLELNDFDRELESLDEDE